MEALGKDTVQGKERRHGYFSLLPDKRPSVKTLFADSKFPESSLSRATLGKAFAEGFWAFAEGFGPSAKSPRPVVVLKHRLTGLVDNPYVSTLSRSRGQNLSSAIAAFVHHRTSFVEGTTTDRSTRRRRQN